MDMWTREQLKLSAKESLKGNYWQAFWVGIVLAIFSGIGGGGGGGGGGSSSNWETAERYFGSNDNFMIIAIAIIVLAVLYRILIGFSLEVGSRKYFVQLAQGKNTEGCYGFAFDGSNYRGIISAMFLKGFYNFLWSLLFVIPGIVKSYSYRMVPNILADNPRLSADEAITLSRKMMNGHKMDTFVLDLSFLGWYLLGLLALVIGTLFVHPYVYATEAHLYLVLRSNAIGGGFCTYEDLNLGRETNYFDTGNDDNDYFRHDDY